MSQQASTGADSYKALAGLSQALLEKYNTSGPRYTSYPTAPMWTDDFGHREFEAAIRNTNKPSAETVKLPLSLYVHLPFCESRCLFCSCNVVITQQREQAEKYLDFLFRDLARGASMVNPERDVVQFHWGGGTPTYLSEEQMARLFQFQKDHFRLSPSAEVAIEVDPRVTTSGQLQALKELGFNRISLGVQDFHTPVQEAIHRIQPVDMTGQMVDQCRLLGFEGINFDLIYGLPHQTVESFGKTLDTVMMLNPDRIALYNFAYVPWMSPHQKAIPQETLPKGTTKFRIFRLAIERLVQAGYVYIGMDHFAKPTDELCMAQQEGSLHRNFMGYTTKAGCELYGFGVSAISGLNDYYAQNEKKLSTYYSAVDDGHLATFRGYALNLDDRLRRDVINSILCQGELSYAVINQAYGVDAQTLFSNAIASLRPMQDDGLLTIHQDGLSLTPLGRIFSRNVAMPFDAYLKPRDDEQAPIISKTL